MKRWIFIGSILLIFGVAGVWMCKNFNFNSDYEIGQQIDALNGVKVYYNGGVSNVTERNTTSEGYNLGLKYQCVEFVKRYYYKHLNHKMPDSYGNAKDFFDMSVKDGQQNKQRGLTQYTNLSKAKPQVNDLLIFNGTIFNKYGHVAIISEVTDTEIEIVQQNPGQFGSSREHYKLLNEQGKWQIDNASILGWLRKEK
ncbi:CHAP domain-containing protein [Pustulibacterium marinum]|uniref:CHAP domain-containing protein n=1 Tax=Pustulibacterium marinum TaxID=1224947 RepID=A0A1I7II64_9FLAO|nr:CHAP domain-containing protein [Pustulibacterium marinum]SFU72634.1 CHAP domain-containing protein [Pustulibacterium marinum]